MTSSPISSPARPPSPAIPQASGRVLYGVHDGAIPGVGYPTNRGVDPYPRHPRRKTAGAPNTSASPPTQPPPPLPLPRPCSKPTPASTPSPSAARKSARPASPTAPPASRSASRRRADPGHGRLARPRSCRRTGRLRRQAALRRWHPSRLRLDVQVRSGRELQGQISIYDRDLRTNETHVVSDDSAGSPIACLNNCSSDGIAELDISKGRLPHPPRPARRRSRRCQVLAPLHECR